jgi:hypothetical protein
MAREACDRMTALSNLRLEVNGLERQFSNLEEEFRETFDLVERNSESIMQML